MARRWMIVCICSGLAVMGGHRTNFPARTSPPISNQSVLKQFKATPLAFEANVGQTDDAASFVARGHGYTMWATADGPLLRLVKPGGSAVVKLRVVGGAPNGHPSAEWLLPGRANYFLGNEPALWKTDVKRYGALRYAGVYPGVDLVLHGTQESLEYDFDVAPHSDPSRVAVSFDGATAVRVEPTGDLTLTVNGGEIGFRPPVAYQEQNGQRTIVPARYDLDADGVVRFALGDYDRTRPLTIDPVLSYSTYLGGAHNFNGNFSVDEAYAIAVDASGNAYVTGFTNAVDFPLAGASLDATCAGCAGSGGDAWIAKIDPSQSGAASLVFSTYLGAGGNGSSIANGIAADGSGNVYVTGWTSGFDNTSTLPNEAFPTTANALQVNDGSDLAVSDAFLTKIDPNGSSLLYSTYLGGTNVDEGNAVKADNLGNVVVVGRSSSPSFPAVKNGYQMTNKGIFDVFVVKFDTMLSGSASLKYGTLLGGSTDESAGAVALDALGRIYITGDTQSTKAVPLFPTFNGFQTVGAAGNDSFVAVIDPSAVGVASLLYSTFMGGDGTESASAHAGGIAVDGSGIVYATGSTFGAVNLPFPTTPGAYNTTPNQTDAYVVKIDPAQIGAPSLLASTLLGGTFVDNGNAITIDPLGNPVVAGGTQSSDFPVTGCSLPKQSSVDAFVTVLDPSLTGLKYSTILGAAGGDRAYGVAMGPQGQIYVTGATDSTNFPTTPNAFDATHQSQCNGCGSTDAFLSVISTPLDACPVPPSAANASATTPEDTAKQITLAATDPGGNSAPPEALIWSVTTGPLHGALSVTSGSMTHGVGSSYSTQVIYTPAANYFGSDSFQFKVNDGTADSNTAAVSITITSVNDAPSANAQSVTTAEEVPKPILLTGSDPENNSLSFFIDTNPAHGALSGSGANRTYTPAANYFGPDSLTFHVTDVFGAASATATVTIAVTNVNDAPVAAADTVTTTEDVPATANVLANDTDADGDSLAVIAPSCNNGAGVQVNANNTITVSPALNFNGAIACSYTADDGHGEATIGQLSVMVSPVNDNPIAAPDTASTDDNTLIIVPVLANDGDPDGDGVALDTVGGCQVGEIEQNADGTITYKPKLGVGAVDVCTYTVTDGLGGTASGQLTVTVTKLNVKPSLVNPGDQQTQEGTGISLPLTATDPDGDQLTFGATGLPTGLSIDPVTGLISGAPAAGTAGAHQVTVTVNDGIGTTSVSFTWVVTEPTGFNQAPQCVAAQPSLGSVWPPDHQLVPIQIVGVTDPDGGQPAITITRVLQDEPTNTLGDGTTWIDGFGVGTSTAQIRAERTGTAKVPGNGRVYEIFFTASDAQGASCTGSVLVGVPRDQTGGPAIDSGVRYDSTVAGGQPINKP